MPPSTHETSILIVDDDESWRAPLAQALADRGFFVRVASDGAEALHLARAQMPQWVVVEFCLGAQSGLPLLRAFVDMEATTQIVVLTRDGSIATAVDAMRLGAASYLVKPVSVDDILAAFQPDLRAACVPPSVAVPSLARVEWEHIQWVLSTCDANISEAARRLGIHRRSLQRKLQKAPPRA